MRRVTCLAEALGLEDHLAEDEIYDDVDDDTADEELTEAESDVDADIEDIEAANSTAEDALDDADTLEEVSDVVDENLESGKGLDDETAAVVEETIESIYRRHGMPKKYIPAFPSLESYSDRSSKLKATMQLKVTLESVIDTVKEGVLKAIEAIKEFFTGLWERFGAFENRLISSFKKLKSKAANIATPNSTEGVAIDSIGEFLSNNSVVSIGEVTSAFEDFSKKIRSDSFKKLIEDIKNAIDSDRAAFNGGAPSEVEKLFSPEAENRENKKLQSAKLVSKFSTVNNPAYESSGTASRIKFATKKEFEHACDVAISLLTMKPLTQMRKVSDNFLAFLVKTSKQWIKEKRSGSKGTAEKTLEYEGEGQVASAKDILKKSASAYKYIMFKNIQVYKETVTGFYDIIDELMRNQGNRSSSND